MAKKLTRRRVAEKRGKIQFQGLRLIASGCKLGELKTNELPTHASQKIGMGVGLDDAEKKVGVNIKVRIDVTYDGVEVKEPPIAVYANFLVTYEIEEPFTSRKLLEDFVQHIAMLNVWPYWREFVQSMTLRMGLPAFPIPTVYIGELIKNSEENKSD